MADRVRARIDGWRAARSDWDDDQAETIWSNEHMAEPDHTLNLSDAHPGGTWSEVATSVGSPADESGPEGHAASATAHDQTDAGHN